MYGSDDVCLVGGRCMRVRDVPGVCLRSAMTSAWRQMLACVRLSVHVCTFCSDDVCLAGGRCLRVRVGLDPRPGDGPLLDQRLQLIHHVLHERRRVYGRQRRVRLRRMVQLQRVGQRRRRPLRAL